MSHNLLADSEPEMEAQLDQIRGGGVQWIRVDLSWALIEPRPGVWNWAPFDALMTAAANAGVHVLGILDYSAPWASADPSGSGNIFYPPRNDADYADYAAAVAGRYGVSGAFWSQHPTISRWPLSAVEIWNEPYGSWYWQPGPDPAAYDALVRAAGPAIRLQDPSMQVLASGDLQSWDDRHPGHQTDSWIARLLRDDPHIADYITAFDVHPYPAIREDGPYDDSAPAAGAYSRLTLIREAELDAGVNLPLWITEIGWSTSPGVSTSVSTTTQAQFVVDAVKRAVEEWGQYVPRVFVFEWARSNGATGDSEHNYGLLNSSGAPSPAWQALTAVLGGVPGATNPLAPQ